MDTEVRFRLTALEERSRETLALGLAIQATLAALPETANVPRAQAMKALQALTQDLSDSAAIQVKAARYLDQILSTVPEPNRR